MRRRLARSGTDKHWRKIFQSLADLSFENNLSTMRDMSKRVRGSKYAAKQAPDYIYVRLQAHHPKIAP